MRSGIGVLAGDEHGEDMQIIVSGFDVSAKRVSGYALQGTSCTTTDKKLLHKSLPPEASLKVATDQRTCRLACQTT